MKKIQKLSLGFSLFLLLCPCIHVYSQYTVSFGKGIDLNDITSESYGDDVPLKWIDVNTTEETWKKEGDVLKCSGQPIGVMRSEKQYENFILHIEWKFMESGGNSGVFVWSGANPPEGKQLPDGVEVQMLDLDYFKVNQGSRIPKENQDFYMHGHLFGVGGVETIPDNRMGETNRSNSLEFRSKGKGNWNTYVVVCVDGVIKLSVNGKFVNGVSKASQKKGYICLESEGAEIHFRNIKIIELHPGITSPEQVAPLL
jgi:hypothetical protein